MDFDKFGYYLAGNRKTYSRQEAIEFAGTSDIQWIFNDDVFSLYDWTTEPVADINHYYDERAKQLRHDYDYIVLFYSGGYDSHNMLRSFIDNKLHVDEIITNIPSLSIFSTPTVEWKEYTSKKIEAYKDVLKNTKIRLIEHQENLIDIVEKNTDLLYDLNYKYTLHHLVKEQFKYSIKEHRDCVESGKKIVYLYGLDKPIVKYDYLSKQYYTQFSEAIVVNKVLPETQRNRIQDVGYEFFYWAPECANLLIKQAHMIKNLFKIRKQQIHCNHSLFNYTLYPRCLQDSSLGFFNEDVYRGLFRAINKKNNIPETACVGGRDSWFYRMNLDSTKQILDLVKHSEKLKKESVVKKYLIGQ